MLQLVNQMILMGSSALQILSFLGKKIPHLATGINNAIHSGQQPEHILNFLSNKIKSSNQKGVERQATENDKYLSSIGLKTKQEKADTRNKIIGGALGVGSGLLAAQRIYNGLNGAQAAVQPQVLSGQPNPIAPIGGPQIPNAPPQQPQIAPPQQPPQIAQQPAPPPVPPPPSPAGAQIANQITQHSPQLQGNPALQKAAQNVGMAPPPQQSQPQAATPPMQQPQAPQDQQLSSPEMELKKQNQMIKDLYGLAQKPSLPKNATPEVKQFLKYAKSLMRSGDIPDQKTMGDFYKWWTATPQEKRGNPRTEFETFRFQTPWLRPQKAQDISKNETSPENAQPNADIASQKESNTQPKTTKAAIGKLAALPNGEIGKIESMKNNVAKINVDGKSSLRKLTDLDYEPEEVVDLVTKALQIPEHERSRLIAFWGYDEPSKELYVQFHNGEFYKYHDVSPENLKELEESKGVAKTTGKDQYGKHVAGVADSRGAALIGNIIRDPKYGKQNKGKTYVQIKKFFDHWQKLRRQPKKRKSDVD